MMKKDDKIVQESSVKYQFLAAAVVNLQMISYGVACGWSSPSLLILVSDETPLPTGKISMEVASWVASLLCVGGLIGNIFFGFITNAYGRRWPLILISIPVIVSWSLIYFCQNVYYLYAARILNGIVGGGIFVIVPIFLSEIANDRVRGILGSTIVLSCNIGMLCAFTLGNFCSFYTTPIFVIALTIVYALCIFSLPETPAFLMKQNKISETEKSIRFYQNMHGKANDFELLQLEMLKLKNTNESPKLADNYNSGNSFDWSDLIQAPGRKAITIGIVLAALNQFCGCFAMLNYTAKIFKEAGSNMSPNMSAIIVGVIQLFGSYMATNLVERAGRKFLYAISTMGTAIGLITLGVYMMLKSWRYDVDDYNWIPIASFSFVIFIASWAVLTLPFLVIAEIMPIKLKEFGISFCMTLLWSFAFIIIKCLPLLADALGFHGTMFLFAGFCIASAAFILCVMPETKGKTYEQIMNSLQ